MSAPPEIVPGTVLSEPDWHARRDAHRGRIGRWTRPHHERRARGVSHPVLDFLFTYYSQRPSRLLRWHPGHGVGLAGTSAREYLAYTGYAEVAGGIGLGPHALTGSRGRTVAFVRDLLTATRDRPARFNCFGLHEWAMVYRQGAEQLRHANWPLRLGQDGTDEVLHSLPVRCSHHDAFRFFTPQARPLNLVQPSREQQVALEQPGCLHAGMDLYKWAYKLTPFVPGELVADCFELAVRIRELDMRASPYDLSALGYSPVAVETAEGRAEYARAQAAFTEQARPLREWLLAVCTALTSAGATVR